MRTASGSFVATGGEALFDAGRPWLKVHAGRRAEEPARGAMREATSGDWPLHPIDAVAISLAVTAVAAGWILAAALVTGPALAAADGLVWATRASKGG